MRVEQVCKVRTIPPLIRNERLKFTGPRGEYSFNIFIMKYVSEVVEDLLITASCEVVESGEAYDIILEGKTIRTPLPSTLGELEPVLKDITDVLLEKRDKLESAFLVV